MAPLDPAAGHEFVDHPVIGPWVVGAERREGLSDRRWVEGRCDELGYSAPTHEGR
jgi:hypothetical protein